jgi:hypothetical protein
MTSTGTAASAPAAPTTMDGRSDAAFALEEDRTEDAVPGVAGWWRRNRTLVVIGLVLLLGLVLGVAGTPRGEGEPLGADNPAPEGARALAQVLGREGVEVREESSLATVLEQAAPGVSVLVIDSNVLAPDQLRELRGSGATLVLVEPSLPVLQVLAPELTLGGVAPSTTAAPGCDDPDATIAGPVRAGGTRYAVADGGALPGVDGEVAAADADAVVCYADGAGANPDAGSYAVVADQTGDRRVVVHGQPELLTNEWLAEEGNAALALRSLGRDDLLLWYRVDPFDVALGQSGGEPPSAVDLLPGWVAWVVAQLLVVTVVAVLWRFRRLGRLVPERLPAVVRSAETTAGRARLYRAAGARGTSAQILRRASLQRLAARLSTGATSDPVTVARLAAAATGRDPLGVGALLHGPPPADDAGLVRLADDLDRLEREVAAR